ncbi:MAG: hypothetical protein V4619_03460 [Bacteroidota bacterium]
MKKLYPLMLFLVLLCFTGCVDIVEEYDFKADGACTVVYDFNMSRAVSVFKNLVSDSVKQTEQFNMVKDTTLSFLAVMSDSVKNKLSAADLAMANGTDLSVKMDLNKSLMKMSITHTASTPEKLQTYLENLSKISLDREFDAVVKNNRKTSGFDAQQLVAGQDYYDYEITSNKFYRVVNKGKFNAFLKKTQSTLAMAKAMLIDMPYKVVLNFAKPVKKVNNAKAIVSADRRRVTLTTTMDDAIKDPSIMNLKIDF